MLKDNFTEIFSEQIPSMFGEVEASLNGFNKDIYKSTVEAFIQNHKPFFDLVEGMTSEDIEDGTIIQEMGLLMVEQAKKGQEGIKSKAKLDKYTLDLNLFMVAYVLPSIMEVASGRVGKAIDEGICAVWSEHFKNAHIQAASIADIDGGFKRKLCYVTTATCLALNLGTDCEELKLLKAYRDDVLMKSDAGRAIVSQYYNIAPTIVKRIDSLQEAKEIYVNLYQEYIEKCIACLKDKETERCLSVYSEMVEKLADRFVRTNR